jgi:hypothetical protein
VGLSCREIGHGYSFKLHRQKKEGWVVREDDTPNPMQSAGVRGAVYARKDEIDYLRILFRLKI